MEFKFTVDVGGVERVMRGIADNAKDLDSALKAYGSKWLRQSVQRRFDQQGPGWPALSKRSERRGWASAITVAKSAPSRFRRKLEWELRRAQKNRDRLSDPIRRASEEAKQRLRASRGGRYRSMTDVIAAKQRAVLRREEMLRLFDRIVAASTGAAVYPLGKTETPRAAKLGERFNRAQDAAQGPMLGKIASSFSMTVRNNTLTYGSKIPWAGVHDKGGTAGHGAKIDPRPFAYLDDRDLDVLVDMLIAQLGHNVTVD